MIAVHATKLGVLYQGDCVDLLHNIYPKTVDCIFADPPFNLGKNYGTKVDDLRDDYEQWCQGWLRMSWRRLSPGGALFLYHMPEWCMRLGGYLLSQGATFRHWIACYMPTSPPIQGKLHPSHYGLLYLTKGKPRVFNRLHVPVPTCRHCHKELKDYGGHRKHLNEKGLSLSDFWADTHGVRHRKFKFGRTAPALPPFMAERCVLSSTNPSDTVLEPFAGSAVAAAAAERHGRAWLASEMEDCEPAKRRIAAAAAERDKAS